MHLDMIPHSFTVGNYEFTGFVPAQICSACNENTVDAKYLMSFELGIATLLAIAGVASSEVFTFMRKAVGLKAKDLAKLFGVTPETVSRWENGKIPVETRSITLLGNMVVDKTYGVTNTIARLLAISTNQPKMLKRMMLVQNGISVYAKSK